MLLVEEIAKKEKIEVADVDVDQEIERMAKQQGRKPLAVRARLEAERRLDSLKDELLGRKVEDYLMENNTISVVEPKPKSE
jgi:FKBP-type peptidyl-prolyl cis-trans isomerase (trigger factor)